MKKYWSSIVITVVVTLLLGVLPQKGFAQLGDPGDDPDAPIDGGVSLLVAAGVGYGIKKARDQRQKQRIASMQEDIPGI